MSYKYQLNMKLDVREIHSGVRDMEDNVNDFMNGCGFSEKIRLQSECPLFELTSDKELTQEEMEKIVEITNDSFKKSGKNIQCTGIKRIMWS